MNDVQPDHELNLQDARSVRESLGRIVQLAEDGAKVLDARIEDEALDGKSLRYGRRWNAYKLSALR